MTLKKILIIIILLLPVFINSCGILDQAAEVDRFANSKFKILKVEVVNVAGVDVSNIKNQSDLNMGDIMTLTGKMFNGGLPTKIKAYIEVENTSSQKAAFSGMEWRLLMKQTEYTSGSVNNRVEVMPYSKTVFPLNADIDLLKVLQSESLPEILNVVLNMDDAEAINKLGIELKLKPYFKTATGLMKYPGYFNLRP